MPVACKNCTQRGCRHQLSSTIPRSPGIIPVAPATNRFRPLHYDCSIKERGDVAARAAVWEGFVLHNFCTGQSGE